MTTKHKKQAPKGQRNDKVTNIVRLITSKPDVFDHYKEITIVRWLEQRETESA